MLRKMEPPYSYDRNAVPNEGMRAMGMGQGFDQQMMNHSYYDQQPKYPFFPEPGNQHGGWPPANTQMFSPHPYGPQGYGSLPSGMEGYGSYPMGHQQFGSHFQHQHSFGSFPHEQPALTQMDGKAANPENIDPKSFDMNIMNQKTYSMSPSNREMYDMNVSSPKTFGMNIPDQKCYDMNSHDQRALNSNGTEQNTLAQDSKSDLPFDCNVINHTPMSLIASRQQHVFEPAFANQKEQSSMQHCGDSSQQSLSGEQKEVKAKCREHAVNESDIGDQIPSESVSCSPKCQDSIPKNESLEKVVDRCIPPPTEHKTSCTAENMPEESQSNKEEMTESGAIKTSLPSQENVIKETKTKCPGQKKVGPHDQSPTAAGPAEESHPPSTEQADNESKSQSAKPKGRRGRKPKQVKKVLSPLTEKEASVSLLSKPNHTANKRDDAGELEAEIKEEPPDGDDIPEKDTDDGGSLKNLFPNLVSSCNREDTELDPTVQESASDDLPETAAALNEPARTRSTRKRKMIDVPQKIHESMIPPSERVSGGTAGFPLKPSEAQATLPPSAAAPLPAVPIPMTTKLDIVMAGMLNPYESGRKPTGPKQYICPACGKQLSDRGTLTRHLKIHTGERKHVCQYCSKTFIQSSELTKHIRTHTGEKPYACSQCERTFIDNSSLRHHMLNHTGEKKHKCHICGRAFAQIGNLRVHLKGKHADVSAFFNCTACGERFDKQRDLKAHLKTHAVGLPPRVLNQFGVDVDWQVPFGAAAPIAVVNTKKTPAKSNKVNAEIDLNLVDKLAMSADDSVSGQETPAVKKDDVTKKEEKSKKKATRTEKKVKVAAEEEEVSEEAAVAALPPGVALMPDVGIAGPNTPSPAGMAAVAAAVMATKPVTSKPGYVLKDGVLFFVCQICFAEFNETPAFRKHMKTHTIKRPLPKLPCPVPGCDSVLTGNSTLRRHLRIHAGARPHQCTECNKSFVHAHDLTVHMRVHTGERPYACTQCDRRFHDNSSFHRHRMWHTGQKPFVCPFCHKAFGQTGNLRVHMRSLHNADPDERYNCQFCPKSFCSVPTLDKHIMNKHSDQFPEGYTPAAGGRLGLGLGGVTGSSGEDEPPRTSVHDLMKYSVEAPAMNINTEKDVSSKKPRSKRRKKDVDDDSSLSLASNENSNMDSLSSPSHSESNSQVDTEPDSHPTIEGTESKPSSSDSPDYESAMRSMVSQLVSRLRKKHGIENDSDVSDTSDEEEEEEEEEGEEDESENDEDEDACEEDDNEEEMADE